MYVFPSRFLKCSFHKCIRSSLLAAFNLALEVFFVLFTSFTVCLTIWDFFLSSTEFLILFIRLWMYSVCSFKYALDRSVCAFIRFWAQAWVGFILLHRDADFTLTHFFLTAKVSHGTQYFDFSLFGMHSAAASMWTLTKFSFSSLGANVSEYVSQFKALLIHFLLMRM